LKRGIGTDFDIDMLFAAMVSAEGFEARIARIADRDDLPFDRAFPNSYFLRAWDVAVKLGDQWRFYDASARTLPAGMLSWHEEGAQALISDPKEPLFVQTPISDTDKSVASRKGAFELSPDGALAGEVHLAYTGHEAAGRRADLSGESATQREQDVRDMVRKQYNNAEVSEVKIENVDDPEKPLAYSYRVVVPGYAQRTGKRMFLQLAYFERGLPAKFTATDRKYPVMFRYPWTEEDEVIVKPPAGYTLENPEAPNSFPMGQIGGYEASIQTGNGQLTYHRKLVFGRGGGLAYQLKVYPAVKLAFDMVHTQDEHTLTLHQQAPPAGASQ
jgi:hypothetical protein